MVMFLSQTVKSQEGLQQHLRISSPSVSQLWSQDLPGLVNVYSSLLKNGKLYSWFSLYNSMVDLSTSLCGDVFLKSAGWPPAEGTINPVGFLWSPCGPLVVPWGLKVFQHSGSSGGSSDFHQVSIAGGFLHQGAKAPRRPKWGWASIFLGPFKNRRHWRWLVVDLPLEKYEFVSWDDYSQ